MASLLEEDNGNASTMRLISIMLVIAAIIFGGYILYAKIDTELAGQIFFGCLFFGVAGKAGQKALELYLGKKGS